MCFLYHPGKADVVANVLSRLSMGSVSHVEEAKRNIVKDVHRFSYLGVWIEYSPNGGLVVHHNFRSYLVVEVKSKQQLDQAFIVLKEYVLGKLNDLFSLGGMVF